MGRGIEIPMTSPLDPRSTIPFETHVFDATDSRRTKRIVRRRADGRDFPDRNRVHGLYIVAHFMVKACTILLRF